jgi:hypothetical protein
MISPHMYDTSTSTWSGRINMRMTQQPTNRHDEGLCWAVQEDQHGIAWAYYEHGLTIFALPVHSNILALVNDPATDVRNQR